MSDDLALPDAATLAVQLDEATVRRVHDEIAAAVAAADVARATLREIGGPEPGAFANQLAFKLNTGAGFFRSAQADIEAAWRVRNVIAKKGESPC